MKLSACKLRQYTVYNNTSIFILQKMVAKIKESQKQDINDVNIANSNKYQYSK